MATYKAYGSCLYCKRKTKIRLSSNFLHVYKYCECGAKYCKECGNRSCPNCGSLIKFEVGKAYA